jgi:upstream-binding transcription factor
MSSDAQMNVDQPAVQEPAGEVPKSVAQPASEQPASEQQVQASGSQPKKPVGGAFGRFQAENRDALAEECKGQPITAVTKLASERFKALSEEDKAVWQKKFQEAKEKYENDVEAFMAAGGEIKKADKLLKRKGNKSSGNAAKKIKVDPDAPKKPVGGAYGRFLAQHRAEFQKQCEGKPVPAVTKLAGDKWKALTDEEKKPYQEEYEKAVALYKEAMKSYTPPEQPADASKPRLSKLAKKSGSGKRKGGKAQKDLAAPKKPVGGAYGRFVAQHRAEFQKQCEGKPVSAVSKLAGDKWKALTDEEKKPYQEEYEKVVAAYKEAMKNYSPPQQDAGTGPDTPAKKSRASKEAVSDKKLPAKPKATGKPKAAAPAASAVLLDAGIAAEAEKAGFTNALLKLAGLSDVAARGKNQADMLKALQDSNGLLHPAKRALLGA